MPVYTYRREDGTTFDIRQSFKDDALSVDPETGQKVVRLVQSAGIVFKGSGFYVNDSKSASKSTLTSTSGNGKDKETKEAGSPAAENTPTADAAASSNGKGHTEEKPKSKELSPIPQSAAAD